MIKLKNLVFGNGVDPVFGKTSLHVFPGECLAVLGTAGSGKTGLLRAVAGLDPILEGEIWLDGCLVSLPGRCMRPHSRPVSMVFQDAALWPHMTVREHLQFAAGRGKRMIQQMRIAYLLERVGLAEIENKYPEQLSADQRQRLELGRALSRQPRILLLDEPLADLDSQVRQRLLLDIGRITKEFDMTILYATRKWREAVFIADRIAALDKGRIDRLEFADHYSPHGSSSVENSSTPKSFPGRGKVIHMHFRRMP